MKNVICYEIKNGILTGEKFKCLEDDFKLDIKQCAKAHIKNGYKIFVDSATFDKIKV